MAERSITWLIGPKNRCRQIRYRGVTKNNQWRHLRMADLNLRRMINLGLQHKAGGDWIIPGTPATRKLTCTGRATTLSASGPDLAAAQTALSAPFPPSNSPHSAGSQAGSA
jgi:hypothetical protein